MVRRRQDHYEVLGVTHAAPEEVVRAAYRALAAKYHPDRNPGDSDAELRLKRVNAAFQVLGNREKRVQYDELTQSPEGDTEPPATRPKRSPPRRSVENDDAEDAAKSEHPPEPRWKVPGSGERAHTIRADRPSRPDNTGSRALLACAAAGLSLYINVRRGGGDLGGPAAIGLVIGCTLLALFVYWLAGKIGLLACGLGLALLAAASISLQGGCATGPAATTPDSAHAR